MLYALCGLLAIGFVNYVPLEESELCNMEDFTWGTLYVPKIINGSSISIGRDVSRVTINVDQHFNWFQKLMWKWCFGATVQNYSEE